MRHFLEIKTEQRDLDSEDWVVMLSHMYCSYIQDKRKQFDMIAEHQTATSWNRFVFLADNIDELIAENGTHRMVRVSPHDPKHRRHTMFSKVMVFPCIEELPNWKPEDIEVIPRPYFGGQMTNGLDFTARLKHRESGIEIHASGERGQIKNKEMALRYLNSYINNTIPNDFAKRSYVLDQNRVKDHQLEITIHDTASILRGYIDPFLL